LTPKNNPVGYLDLISNGVAYGWALDPDDPLTSILVDFYVGETFVGQTVANLSRPDVASSTGYAGNHGFEFTIPSTFRDNVAHNLFPHGIDIYGGTNPVLNNSPLSFKLQPIVVPISQCNSNGVCDVNETFSNCSTDCRNVICDSYSSRPSSGQIDLFRLDWISGSLSLQDLLKSIKLWKYCS
jgi:hypothetical protein